MSNKIFVDTNVIIDLFKPISNKYVDTLKQMLADDNVDLYINNFVVAEILQGVKIKESKKYQSFRNFLESSFIVIEIDDRIIQDSIDIYRKCKANGINFNNENFCPITDCNRIIYNSIDCIHYATCCLNDLQMLTNDQLFTAIDKCNGLNIVHI